MPMQITYDREADALYIKFGEGTHECLVRRVTPQVAIDLGENDAVVGIEILDASKLTGDERQLKLFATNIDVTAA